MKNTTVLIPTYNRPDALAVTLTSLCFQEDKSFDVIISDQSSKDLLSANASVQNAIRLLEIRGHDVKLLRNLPPRGMAQQRQFLLDQCTTSCCLFLDDDLILEPYVISIMSQTIHQEDCGFVGSAVIGLSYKEDFRPDQQQIEIWQGPVQPEVIIPKSVQWQRYPLHNAANVWHVQQKLNVRPENPLRYKVAWVGGCVMYFTEKLKAVGGFNFWKDLPEKHCGEDVLAQLRVMKVFGGCGILPSGVYHQELQTTVPDRNVNAPEYLEI